MTEGQSRRFANFAVKSSLGWTARTFRGETRGLIEECVGYPLKTGTITVGLIRIAGTPRSVAKHTRGAIEGGPNRTVFGLSLCIDRDLVGGAVDHGRVGLPL